MRELELLEHVYGRNAGLPGRVIVPPGDDMAALKLGDRVVLATVDQLAEGVHFELGGVPLDLVGRKAVTRNLSDVAAMAAKPVGGLAAACLPRGFGEDRAKALFDAMHETAAGYGCPLVGGDISVWEGRLLLTVTVLAEPAGIEPVTRSGAKPGDVVCVTGELGGAWAGGGAEAPHMRFEPRVDLARRLASIEGLGLRAMIDLSDGLGSDLSRVCERSGVGAEIEVARVPVRAEAEAAAEADGAPAWRHALADGEDYELCFTVGAAEAEAALPEALDGVAITRVGRIVKRDQRPEGGLIWLRHEGGKREALAGGGWEHRG